MQYLGGKTRIAKQLAAEIDKVRRPGQWVWDAFCGGLSMTVALSKNGPVYSTDACVPLINLYRAVQAGWDPPSVVDEATYRAAKALPDTDPMKAFCGFGCSFGGKWFGGWGGPSKHHPTGLAVYTHNSLRTNGVPSAALDVVDFLKVQPSALDGVLYLDPPYAGTTGYGGAAPFDHAMFYSRVREWSKHCHVWVSEYQMPFGRVVFERASKTKVNAGLSGTAKSATERLYFVERGSL